MITDFYYVSSVPEREKQLPPQDNPPAESNPDQDRLPIEIREQDGLDEEHDYDVAVNDFLEYINFIC